MDDELSQLVEEGTLVPVQFSEWAAPIVVVLKGDKSSICICGDFTQTVNSVSKLDVSHTESRRSFCYSSRR